MRHIYLDHAAATPLDPAVLEAMSPYFSEAFHNPSALYGAGRRAKGTLEAARAQAARVLGAKPAEIIFTSGGTEANNLAIHGILSAYPGGNVIVSAIEHDSVLMPAGAYGARLASVNGQGIVDLAVLEKLIDDNTVLISVMYANNEVGSIQPIAAVTELAARIRTERQNGRPLYVHTDACQAAAYLNLQVSRLGVDLLTLNAGKIYGPKGSGALYVRSGVQLKALSTGGGQENGRRSGTENVPGAVGFAEALSRVQARRHTETRRLQALQQLFFKQLSKTMPKARINGTTKRRLPNNLHITIPGQDNERLMMALDERGIMAATGSACSASNEAASHVLLAMGLSEADARASLRLTMGQATTEEDIERLLQALADLVAR